MIKHSSRIKFLLVSALNLQDLMFSGLTLGGNGEKSVKHPTSHIYPNNKKIT